MKPRPEATGGREASCPRCRLPVSLWTGQGFTRRGNIYCCQGCAEGTGCICNLRQESKRRRPLTLDDRAVDRGGDEGAEEVSNEGRHMNLEKLLYDGGSQTQKRQSRRGKQRIIPRREEVEQTYGDDAGKGTDYENDEGSRLQRELRRHATRKSVATSRNIDYPSRPAHSGATDWQDFEDYRPGYSGHQTKGTPGGGVFPSENFEGAGDGHPVSSRAVAKVQKRYARKMVRRKTGSLASRRKVIIRGLVL